MEEVRTFSSGGANLAQLRGGVNFLQLESVVNYQTLEFLGSDLELEIESNGTFSFTRQHQLYLNFRYTSNIHTPTCFFALSVTTSSFLALSVLISSF